MGMRRSRRAMAAGMALIVITSAAPVATADSGRPSRSTKERSAAVVDPELGIRLRMLRQLEELRAPEVVLEALTDAAATRVRRGRSVDAFPMNDVTDDRVAEIVEFDLRYSFVIGDDGQGFNTIDEGEFTTVIRIRNGRTGRLHWKKRYRDFVLPGRANVGHNGRKGVIAIGGILSFFGGSTEQRYLTFQALRGDTGKRLWSKRYTSVAASHDFTTQVVTNTPVSFALVQARKDKATEILLGLANITEATFTMTAATRTLLLSGSDGSEVMHPSIDIGIDWLPYPDAVSDVDGDGLDDYVVINDKGFDPGEGQEPPRLGGVIQARRGVDGGVVWTEGGLEFRFFAWTIPLPGVVGDRRRDFGVLTYNSGRRTSLLPTLPFVPALTFERDFSVVMLVDAGVGDVKWTRRATWAHSPGDVDRDGDPDVVLERFRYDERANALHYLRLAYPGVGRRLWQHRLVWRGDPCLARLCLGGAGIGMGSAGDTHPDGVRDRFVAMGLFQHPNNEERASFVLDGRADDTLIRSDDTLMPLGVSLDRRGTDVLNARVDRQEARFRARNGSTGHTLWTLGFTGPQQLLPKQTYGYGIGFSLPGDGCGDVVFNIGSDDGTLYAVVDGANAKVLWSKWTGAKAQRPHVSQRRDLNPSC